MSETRQCKQCGKPFVATREDHWFDSPACVAKWYREHPDPEYIHAEKDHDNLHHCEQCGKSFYVNDYAERKGQRLPKYCSVACKQKAYRERGKATQEQAKRRQEDAEYEQAQAWEREFWRKKNERDQQQQQQRPPRSSGGTSRADALTVLGMSDPFTAAALKARWLQMIKHWHPDTNSAPEATVMSQRINWAYDTLKKGVRR